MAACNDIVFAINSFNQKYAKYGNCTDHTLAEYIAAQQLSGVDKLKEDYGVDIELKDTHRVIYYDYVLDGMSEDEEMVFWEDFRIVSAAAEPEWELDGSGNGLAYGMIIYSLEEYIEELKVTHHDGYAQIVAECNYETSNLDDYFTEMLRRFRPQVIEYLNAIDERDWYTYEGGVDIWWGPGSVMLCELGIEVNVKYHATGITITL